MYLIVDLCEGGELGSHAKKMGPLPEETVKHIMSKLVNALYYLHKMGKIQIGFFSFNRISVFRYCTSRS